MLSKSCPWILALGAIGVLCHSPQANANKSAASVTFSGYVAPACDLISIDANTVLPPGADPQNYVLLRCNNVDTPRSKETGII